MNLEIERKFLIKNTEFKKTYFKKKHIIQGFLNSNKNRVVRVRIIDNSAFLTIKGISDKSGTTRFEWEKEINSAEAEQLLLLCEPSIITKTRFYIKAENHIFEVDEFYGDNEGLIIAEIELNTEDELFKKPLWLGTEVTGDKRYYNSSLSKIPFKIWAKIYK